MGVTENDQVVGRVITGVMNFVLNSPCWQEEWADGVFLRLILEGDVLQDC